MGEDGKFHLQRTDNTLSLRRIVKPVLQEMLIPHPSRRRSLLRDVARGIGQHMFFWGCDTRHPDGNLLSLMGMERLARVGNGREGSSRYRMKWKDGLIELHSYCVGWYAGQEPFQGVVFIRNREQITSCMGPLPLTPGRYERERLTSGGIDELLPAVGPLIEWILFYENQIGRLAGTTYRKTCWRCLLTKTGARPWLPPGELESWFQSFLESPERSQRPRADRFSKQPPRPPAGPLKIDRKKLFLYAH